MNTAIVIPAYNATATLPGVLGRIPTSVAPDAIWIVNDGSRDQTALTVKELARQHPAIRPIHLETNRGYGGAMKVGLGAALNHGAQTVICLHADGQYSPEVLPQMLQRHRQQQLDILQGSRHAEGTARSGGMPLYKILAGRFLVACEQRVLSLPLTDFHSGLLIYSQRALTSIPLSRLSNSFDFDLEVITWSRSLGLAVAEHPIPTHYGDEVSYLNPVGYGLRVLGVLAKYLTGHYKTPSKEHLS